MRNATLAGGAIPLILLLAFSACTSSKGKGSPSAISLTEVKNASVSEGVALGEHQMEWPFERPYAGPYRLPRNRIAYTPETLETYPFLKDLSIKPGIYSLRERTTFGKTASTVDISHDGFIAPATGNVKCLVIKVQYDSTKNNPAWTNAEIRRRFFDPDSSIPGGSMRDFYFNQSYGSLTLTGDIYPSADGVYYQISGVPRWSGGTGYGTVYLDRSQWLSLIGQADADINFADYDVDGNGNVDALLVLYRNFDNDDNPGSSYEHREYVGPVYWAPTIYLSDVYRDGKYLLRGGFLDSSSVTDYDFTAFHEFGHILGLPDLYDYGGDYAGRDNPGPDGDESWGNGWWELMAAGNYVWPPQNLSALSKYTLGWVEPINIDANRKGLRIPPVEGGINRIYRAWKNGEMGPEYFLLENRGTNGQWLYKSPGVWPSLLYRDKTPSSSDLRDLPPGLLIWHVDENVYNAVGNYGWGCNDWEEHKFLDMEENSVTYQFLYSGVIVDAGRRDSRRDYLGGTYDPWPQTFGATYDSFTANTVPNSNAYDGTPTISITNIRRDGVDILVDISVGDPDIEFTLPKAVQSGVLSFTPSLAQNVNQVEYTFNGEGPVIAVEAPYTFEYDASSLPFGSYEFSALARGEATDATDFVTFHVIVDNSTGAFPFMENYERLPYQSAGTGFTSSSPFKAQSTGFGNSSGSFGIYDAGVGYLNNLRALLVLPLIDLTQVSAPTLVFRQKYNLEENADFLSVVVSTDDFGTVYEVPKTRGGRDAIYTGFRDSGWQTAEVNLTPWAGQKVRIGFLFTSDAEGVGEDPGSSAGWWIDNIVIAQDYADTIPFITDPGIDPRSVVGLAVQRPELNITPVTENDPAGILYTLITATGVLEGEITASPFNVVLDLSSFGNQTAELVLQPRTVGGFLGPAVSTPFFIYNLRGDANADGVVNELDLVPIMLSFGINAQSAEYFPWLDGNADGEVDERDASAVGYFFGES